MEVLPDVNGKPVNTGKPQCKRCHKKILTRTSSTTNLFYHLEHKHLELYKEICKATQEKDKDCDKYALSSAATKSVKEMLESQLKWSRNSREHKDLIKSVTHFLAKDMVPAYTIVKTGFGAMLEKFNPCYDLPSRNYFSRVAISSLYSKAQSSLQQKIDDWHFTFFAGTTDLSSSITNKPYLSYTIHSLTRIGIYKPSAYRHISCLKHRLE